jgi:hypothetical protein
MNFYGFICVSLNPKPVQIEFIAGWVKQPEEKAV